MGVPTQSVENVPIINLPRSQCSTRMQRTSATCYFAYNDAAVHANARNHPGDDIKRDRRRHPPGGDSRSRGPSCVPCGTGHDRRKRNERKEEKMDRPRFSPVRPQPRGGRREGEGNGEQKVGKMIPITCRAGSIVVPRKITSPVPL